jgi:NTP-dependent ternary system trypsin peptidase co-occuring protein
MVERVVPMRVGGVDLLVSTVVLPGSEQTSGRMDRAGQKVVDAFDSAQSAIEAIGDRMAATVASLNAQAARPKSVSVEFGLSFTASGGVLVAGASAAASLKVTIAYERAASMATADAR